MTALAVAVAGLGLAMISTGLLRWIATAAVLTTAPPLLLLAREHPAWHQRRGRIPGVLFVALVVLLLGPLLAGDPPSSRDHGIHYFQIRMLVEELLPSGRLWGWSPTLNHGYPYGESYPVLGYLWMAAAHLLSFGAVSLRTSYAWGLASLWMVSAAVAWWLASTIVREFGRKSEATTAAPSSSPSPAEVAGWAGLAAAGLWLLDPGASRQGGWNYLMFHGVWPQLLAATLWAASLGFTLRALAEPTPRRIAAAVLTLGGSLWAHPFGMLTAAASGFAWAVVILVAPGARRWPGPWRAWTVIHVGAGLLGSAWVLTFFGSASAMARGPVPWSPLALLGSDVLQGQLFVGQWAWAGVLVVLGGAAIVRHGGTLGWTTLGLTLGLLAMASEEAITVLRLDLVLSGFKNLQFPRYAIPLKPLWFALAGVGLARVLVWAQAWRGQPTAPAWDRMTWVRRAVVALVLAPLVASVVPQTGRLVARPIGALDTLAADGLVDAEQQLLEALRTEAAALPPQRPLAVAVMRTDMGGGTYPVATVADAGGRLALDSHIPTVNFKYRLRRGVESYASLGITHVIHDRDVPEQERLLIGALEEVGTYGSFTLERFHPPDGRERRVAELQRGEGTVTLIDEDVERLELDVTGIPEGGLLLVGRAPHHRWMLTHDGQEIPMEPHVVDGRRMSVLAAELPGPGRVVLEYYRSARERWSPWVSAVVLLLALAGLGFSGPPLARTAPSPTARRFTWVVTIVVVMAAVWWMQRRQQVLLAETWDGLLKDRGSRQAKAKAKADADKAAADAEPDRPPADDDDGNEEEDDDEPSAFVRDFVVDDAIEVEIDPDRVCSGLLGKDVLIDCSEAAHRPSTSFLYRAPYLYRCQRVSVPAHGTAIIRFPPLADEDHVVLGTIIRHERKGSGKRLLWGQGRTDKQLRNERRDFVIRIDDKGETRTIRLKNESGKIEQACIAAALMRPS